MENIINTALISISFIFISFIIFLMFYGIILKMRKTRKQNIIGHTLEQAKQWGIENSTIKKYSLGELHSPTKIHDLDAENNASDLKVKDYTQGVQWLIKK